MQKLLGSDSYQMELVKNAWYFFFLKFLILSEFSKFSVGIGVTGNRQSIFYVQLTDSNIQIDGDDEHKPVFLLKHNLNNDVD